MKVKVTVTTEDSEVLDSFVVEPTARSYAQRPNPTVVDLSNRIRSLVEDNFEVEDSK